MEKTYRICKTVNNDRFYYVKSVLKDGVLTEEWCMTSKLETAKTWKSYIEAVHWITKIGYDGVAYIEETYVEDGKTYVDIV